MNIQLLRGADKNLQPAVTSVTGILTYRQNTKWMCHP